MAGLTTNLDNLVVLIMVVTFFFSNRIKEKLSSPSLGGRRIQVSKRLLAKPHWSPDLGP